MKAGPKKERLKAAEKAKASIRAFVVIGARRIAAWKKTG